MKKVKIEWYLMEWHLKYNFNFFLTIYINKKLMKNKNNNKGLFKKNMDAWARVSQCKWPNK
jgi:hypothetical protein